MGQGRAVAEAHSVDVSPRAKRSQVGDDGGDEIALVGILGAPEVVPWAVVDVLWVGVPPVLSLRVDPNISRRVHSSRPGELLYGTAGPVQVEDDGAVAGRPGAGPGHVELDLALPPGPAGADDVREGLRPPLAVEGEGGGGRTEGGGEQEQGRAGRPGRDARGEISNHVFCRVLSSVLDL